MAFDAERQAAEEARQAVNLLERRRIALQTELDDVRALLESVRQSICNQKFNQSLNYNSD